MKILIFFLIILIIIFFIRNKVNEKFTQFIKPLEYPDRDLEVNDTWNKSQINYNLLNKKALHKFIKILEKEYNIFFESRKYRELLKENKEKLFTERVPFIIQANIDFINELLEAEIKRHEIFAESVNNNFLNKLINYLEANLNNNNERSFRNFLYKDENTSAKSFKNNVLTELELVSGCEKIYDNFLNKDVISLVNIYFKKLKEINKKKNLKRKPIPCVMYDKSICLTKDNCSWIEDDNTCVPKEKENNFPVMDCNSISKYGKHLCEITDTLIPNQNQITSSTSPTIDSSDSLSQCVWQDETKTCKNPNESLDIKCEDIKNDDDDDDVFKQRCEGLKNEDDSSKCNYEKSRSSGASFCIDKDSNNHSKMTCINFTNVLTIQDDKEILDRYNCDQVNLDGKNIYFDKRYINEEIFENLDCGHFDTSNYKLNQNKTHYIKKDNSEKYRGTKENAKMLCQQYTNNRCNYIEHSLYNNEKIDKCIPKDVHLSDNYIKDEAECKMLGNQFLGKKGNKKCVNINAKCNDIKHSALCTKLSNRCYWTPTGSHPPDSNDTFERGYCMNNDTLDLEKMIDDFHNHEISQKANINELLRKYEYIEKDLNSNLVEVLQKKHNINT